MTMLKCKEVHRTVGPRDRPCAQFFSLAGRLRPPLEHFKAGALAVESPDFCSSTHFPLDCLIRFPCSYAFFFVAGFCFSSSRHRMHVCPCRFNAFPFICFIDSTMDDSVLK